MLVDFKWQWLSKLLLDKFESRLQTVVDADQIPEARCVTKTISKLSIDLDQDHSVLNLL